MLWSCVTKGVARIVRDRLEVEILRDALGRLSMIETSTTAMAG